MEASSPLAALQPGAGFLGPWAGPQDHPSDFAHPGFSRPCSYEVTGFNFRDMSMLKPQPDYFSCRPVRGSSPTASLAVDLSQNFHIDRTPQLPTPRRSLFTGNLLDVSRRQAMLTPPIPSSSPAPQPDDMDCSPLPHKQPLVLTIPANLCSPTPEATPIVPDVETLLSVVPPPLSRAQSQPQAAVSGSPAGRRVKELARPAFRKTQSTTAITKPRSASSATTPFIFGFGPTSSYPKLALETFAESPPSERKSSAPAAICHNAASTSAAGVVHGSTAVSPPFLACNGSPLAPLRRAPPPRAARIGLGRRTQSVQYNNNPFKTAMRQEKRSCTTGSYQPASIGLDSVATVQKPKLPHFTPEDDAESLPRITKETAVEVLNGVHDDIAGPFAIIDCRFEYEYQGGHINGAQNFNDKEDLAKQLFEYKSLNAKTLIFHCEYSACRAPQMASFIRQRDRMVNQDNYPYLTFPEIYILDGGYSGFFKSFRSHCFPQSYVEMHDEKYETACEMGMAKVKRRGKLSRAQTYAFGQSQTTTVSTESTLLGGSRPAMPTLKLTTSFLNTITTSNNSSALTFDSMDIDMSPASSVFTHSPLDGLRSGIDSRSSLSLICQESSPLGLDSPLVSAAASTASQYLRNPRRIDSY